MMLNATGVWKQVYDAQLTYWNERAGKCSQNALKINYQRVQSIYGSAQGPPLFVRGAGQEVFRRVINIPPSMHIINKIIFVSLDIILKFVVPDGCVGYRIFYPLLYPII